MPYFRDDSIGTEQYGLQNFAPTSGQSLSATVDETMSGNPVSLGISLYDTRQANRNDSARLTAYDAEAIIKESGVRGLNVEDGQYTRSALDLLIERQRQAQIRADVLSRTEYSLLGTPIRATAMLGTALIDPLNVASAFVPVVGEARIASLLGRTAAGSFARAGTRAGIGAVEGFAGAAMMEPALSMAHSQLQDDYTMSDSLLNLAFGTAFGGGLHAAGGAFADFVRTTDPYARFSGLDEGQVRTVLDFERNGISGLSKAEIDAVTSSWSTRMREAAGLEVEEPTIKTEAGVSKEDFDRIAAEYPREILDALTRRSLSTEIPDAPFAKLADITPERAQRLAINELSDSLAAELLPIAGNRLDKGAVRELEKQRVSIDQQLNTADERFKSLSKQYQQDGNSRKKAEALARQEIDELKRSLDAQSQRIVQQIEMNARATQADQQLAALKKGKVPKGLQESISDRANQILAQAEITRAINPAKDVVSNATPMAREAAFRSAIAQAYNGRIPDVGELLKPVPNINEIKSVAQRMSDPKSLLIGDSDAALAATQRLKESKPNDLVSATNEMDLAVNRLDELIKNLVDSGISQDIFADMQAMLKVYDDEIAKAESYGNAARAAAVCSLRN